MNRWWASDYNSFEKLLYLRDRILTPTSYNRGNFEPVLSHSWNAPAPSINGAKQFSIVFLGDLMPIKGRDLILSEDIKKIIETADLIVINLEGIITSKKRYLALAHNIEILDKIDQLSGTATKLINVANNHSGDFGIHEFNSSVEKIMAYGFPVIGSLLNATYSIGNINLYSSTYWSNQVFQGIDRFSYGEADLLSSKLVKGAYNIFLPHWGYEMHLYPTEKQKIFARYLKEWDLIVGNHPHSPQPIERIKGERDRLVAYSLGNFCYSHYNPNHHCGSILKVSVDAVGDAGLVNYELQLTGMNIDRDNILISPIKNLEYGKLRLNRLKIVKNGK